jgi:hypothetical protein
MYIQECIKRCPDDNKVKVITNKHGIQVRIVSCSEIVNIHRQANFANEYLMDDTWEFMMEDKEILGKIVVDACNTYVPNITYTVVFSEKVPKDFVVKAFGKAFV